MRFVFALEVVLKMKYTLHQIPYEVFVDLLKQAQSSPSQEYVRLVYSPSQKAYILVFDLPALVLK